jgi:hypothetical protein
MGLPLSIWWHKLEIWEVLWLEINVWIDSLLQKSLYKVKDKELRSIYIWKL